LLDITLATLVTTLALSKFGLGLCRISLILIPLMASVYICLGGLLVVQKHSLPEMSAAEGDPDDQQWAKDMIVAIRFNRGRRFCRVDLYRAALRWFLLALLLAPLAVVFRPGIATTTTAKFAAAPHVAPSASKPKFRQRLQISVRFCWMI
jgi:hypothetical protein